MRSRAQDPYDFHFSDRFFDALFVLGVVGTVLVVAGCVGYAVSVLW